MVHHQKALPDFGEEGQLNHLALFCCVWVERNNLEAQSVLCLLPLFLFLVSRPRLHTSPRTCLRGRGRAAWITGAGGKVALMDMWKQPISEELPGLQRSLEHSRLHTGKIAPFQSNRSAAPASLGSYWWGSQPFHRSLTQGPDQSQSQFMDKQLQGPSFEALGHRVHPATVLPHVGHCSGQL